MNQTLNRYGEIATHEDCGDHDDPFRGKCSGSMGIWENRNTGNTRLLCGAHAEQADARQDKIHRELLNDTVFSPDY